MRRRSFFAGLLLACALASGALTGTANAQAYIHAPTQVAFPSTIAGLPRHQVEDYESKHPGLGVSVRYQARKEIRADVYAYTAGLKQIPNDVDHPLMLKLRQQTEREILAYAKSQGFQVRKGESARIDVPTAKGAMPVLYDSFVLIGPGGTQNTFVWLWPARNHFFKIRLTRLPADHDPKQIRDFVETVVGLSAE